MNYFKTNIVITGKYCTSSSELELKLRSLSLACSDTSFYHNIAITFELRFVSVLCCNPGRGHALRNHSNGHR